MNKINDVQFNKGGADLTQENMLFRARNKKREIARKKEKQIEDPT